MLFCANSYTKGFYHCISWLYEIFISEHLNTCTHKQARQKLSWSKRYREREIMEKKEAELGRKDPEKKERN